MVSDEVYGELAPGRDVLDPVGEIIYFTFCTGDVVLVSDEVPAAWNVANFIFVASSLSYLEIYPDPDNGIALL